MPLELLTYIRTADMTNDPPYITFTLENYEALQRAYTKAKKQGLEEFTFEGHRLVTNYAKYLLEYLKQQFGA
jgi:hypothetical protein